MKLTIDFETRSAVELKKSGPWCYAEHWSTDVLCLALKADNEEPLLWIPPKFRDKIADRFNPDQLIYSKGVKNLIEQADIIEAHNAGFERALWFHIMVQRYGFENIDPTKWRCSAAKAAYHALPRSLEKAGSALGLDVAKDQDGHRLMLRMCKPRKPRKNELEQFLGGFNGYQRLDDDSFYDPQTKERFYLWYEDPDRLEKLYRYCLQDAEAEHALSEALRDLPRKELKVWQMDQAVNVRGIYCDIDGVRATIKMIEKHSKKLERELKEITGGQVPSTQAVAAFVQWLKSQRVSVDNLQRQTVEKTLEQSLPGKVRRALEIRLSLSRSSTAKYQAMLDRACYDRRIRDVLLYHGASTGRWSGMGIQPQNMPRGSFEDTGNAIQTIRDNDVDMVEMLWGDPMDVASTCTRAMLCAAPGHDLLCADYSSIEARGVAWLAGSEKLLDTFRHGRDVYKVAAMPIYNKEYEEIIKAERQIGKVVVLACGYQGKVGAFQSMAKNYGLHLEDNQVAEIVDAWRSDNSEIVRFWYGIEEAVFNAVQNPGEIYELNGLKVVRMESPGKGFLHIRLPSGRVLHYYDPQIGEQKNTWGVKEAVTYMGMDSQNGYNWKRLYTYGGKLTENIVQALCRDILAEAQLRLEQKGYPTVLTVHDEIIAEMPEGKGSLEEFENIMVEVPTWATGFPIKAEGWRGKRYRK